MNNNYSIPPVEKLCVNSLLYYPTLYGRSRVKVLDQLFITNGNGYDWINGKLSYDWQENEKPLQINWNYILKQKKDIKKTTLKQSNKLLTNLRSNEKDRFRDFDLISETLISKTIIQPIKFYKLDLRRYSMLGELPNDIDNEHLSAAAYTLLLILHFRSHPLILYYYGHKPNDHYNPIYEEDKFRWHSVGNKTNALILIDRYSKQFGKRQAWRDIIDHPEIIRPEYKEIHYSEIIEKRDERLLELSCKCSLRNPDKNNQREDTTKLNDDEYFDYFELDCTGFKNNELPKLRALHYAERQEKLNELINTRNTKEKEEDFRRFLFSNAKLENNKLTCEMDGGNINYLKNRLLNL